MQPTRNIKLLALTSYFNDVASEATLRLLPLFADRLGKGTRSAPRDALIADEAHAQARGASFGLNRAMDTLGALTGIVAFGVHELRHDRHAEVNSPTSSTENRALPPEFWRFIAVVTLFALA